MVAEDVCHEGLRRSQSGLQINGEGPDELPEASRCPSSEMEASEQSLRTKLPFPASDCKRALYGWVV